MSRIRNTARDTQKNCKYERDWTERRWKFHRRHKQDLKYKVWTIGLDPIHWIIAQILIIQTKVFYCCFFPFLGVISASGSGLRSCPIGSRVKNTTSVSKIFVFRSQKSPIVSRVKGQKETVQIGYPTLHEKNERRGHGENDTEQRKKQSKVQHFVDAR